METTLANHPTAVVRQAPFLTFEALSNNIQKRQIRAEAVTMQVRILDIFMILTLGSDHARYCGLDLRTLHMGHANRA